MKKIMTPEEFATAMKAISKKHSGVDGDPEERHKAQDDLMRKMLRQLGYSKGANAFAGGWYA